MGTKVGAKRTRNWATIIYPRQSEGEETTCPDDWEEVLSRMAVKAVVSPLHDNDVYEEDKIDKNTGELLHAKGELKKPHRHVVIAFDGVKTETQAREIFEKIGGVGCEPISSLFSMTRYLTHIDNPEKAQYSSTDVLCYGGFEYKRYVSTKDDEEKEIVANMGTIFNICAQRNMYDFADTAEYLMAEQPELFTTFRKNPYFFATFFKSKQNLAQKILDYEREKLYNEVRGVSLHNPHYGNPPENEKGGKDEKQF